MDAKTQSSQNKVASENKMAPTNKTAPAKACPMPRLNTGLIRR